VSAISGAGDADRAGDGSASDDSAGDGSAGDGGAKGGRPDGPSVFRRAQTS
jgi:hypothetical protein